MWQESVCAWIRVNSKEGVAVISNHIPSARHFLMPQGGKTDEVAYNKQIK